MNTEMNKEEIIKFIKKYKNCLYYIDKGEKQNIDIDRFMKQIEQVKNLGSDIVFSGIAQIYYYRIYDSVFPRHITNNIIYYIDMNKKNLIDRKEKIKSITK